MKVKDVFNRFFHVYAIVKEMTMIVFKIFFGLFCHAFTLKDVRKIARDDVDKKNVGKMLGNIEKNDKQHCVTSKNH